MSIKKKRSQTSAPRSTPWIIQDTLLINACQYAPHTAYCWSSMYIAQCCAAASTGPAIRHEGIHHATQRHYSAAHTEETQDASADLAATRTLRCLSTAAEIVSQAEAQNMHQNPVVCRCEQREVSEHLNVTNTSAACQQSCAYNCTVVITTNVLAKLIATALQSSTMTSIAHTAHKESGYYTTSCLNTRQGENLQLPVCTLHEQHRTACGLYRGNRYYVVEARLALSIDSSSVVVYCGRSSTSARVSLTSAVYIVTPHYSRRLSCRRSSGWSTACCSLTAWRSVTAVKLNDGITAVKTPNTLMIIQPSMLPWTACSGPCTNCIRRTVAGLIDIMRQHLRGTTSC
eukprot:11678-Heterococcus_DN1.PRE.3